MDAQAEYLKMRYMGYMTMIFVFGALAAALSIYRGFRVGWVIGLINAVASITLFVLTRMIALPGMTIEQWLYPFWLIASVVEGLYLLLFLAASLWESFGSVDGNPASSHRLSLFIPIVGLILISVVTYYTNSWDSYAFLLGYHHHVGSYSAVCDTPPISLEDLEQKYGVRISRIAISMLDSAVDVRLEITDPEKAQKFLQNQSAILVDQQVLIVSPHVHQHFHLHTNRVFVAFFSTQRGLVHPGSEVSLVYGAVRVEPVTVK